MPQCLLRQVVRLNSQIKRRITLSRSSTLVVVPQLLCGTGYKPAHGFDQRRQDIDGVAKTARAGDLLRCSRQMLLMLAHRALQKHALLVPALNGRNLGHVQVGNGCCPYAYDIRPITATLLPFRCWTANDSVQPEAVIYRKTCEHHFWLLRT